MTRDEIQKRVFELVADHLDVPAERVKADASFVDDLGADSLDFVELTLAVEEEWDIEVPDDVAENWKTPGDAIAWLEQRLSTAAA